MAQSADASMPEAFGKPSKRVEVPNLQVCVRIRPLIGSELDHKDEKLNFNVVAFKNKFQVAIKAKKVDDAIPAKPTTPRSKMRARMARRRVKNEHAFSKVNFDHVFTEVSKNADVYAGCDPVIDHLLNQKTSMIFAYGNTGTGKTHTILGYPGEQGLYHMAAEKMCNAVKALNDADPNLKACVRVQFIELYLDNAYDLLNNREECRLREGEDGRFHFRKSKGKQKDGCGLDNRFCSTVDEIEEVVKAGVGIRAMGNSNFHSQSSRSHAVLEMEIVCEEILNIRKKIAQYRSWWVQSCSAVKEGLPKLFDKHPSKSCVIFRIKSKYVKDLVWADADICKEKRFKAPRFAWKWVYYQWEKYHTERVAGISRMGSKLVLVDLAGSEHGRDVSRDLQQSAQEKREGKKINLSLMALNAVFRNKAQNEKQNFRDSTLTKALRDYLEDAECKNLMIATLSSAIGHMKQTVSTLNYASELARCG